MSYFYSHSNQNGNNNNNNHSSFRQTHSNANMSQQQHSHSMNVMNASHEYPNTRRGEKRRSGYQNDVQEPSSKKPSAFKSNGSSSSSFRNSTGKPRSPRVSSAVSRANNEDSLMNSILMKNAENRRLYFEDLRNHCPFIVDYANHPTVKDATLKMGDLRVIVVGIDTDPVFHFLRKKTGLVVCLQYHIRKMQTFQHQFPRAVPCIRPSPSNSSSFHAHFQLTQNISSSALCTFLSRFYNNEISLGSLIDCLSSLSPDAHSITSLNGRSSINGMNLLTYHTSRRSKCTFLELLPRNTRVKNGTEVPPRIPQSLVPLREKFDVNDLLKTLRNPSLALADDDDSDEAGEGEPMDQHAESSRRESKSRASKQPPSNTNVLATPNKSTAPTTSTSLTTSITNQSSLIPSPFISYQYMIVSFTGNSQSVNTLNTLLTHFCSQNPSIGAMSASVNQIEQMLNSLDISVAQAMTAPVISASNSTPVICNDILSFFSSTSSSPRKLPLPIRIGDVCLLLMAAQDFHKHIWPIVGSTDDLYELTEYSPSFHYRGDSIKQEFGTTPPNQSKLPKNDRENPFVSLISSYIRKHSSREFLLYSLPSESIHSSFFDPHISRSMFSVHLHSTLPHSSAVIEWPQDFPFQPHIIFQWCNHWIRVAEASCLKIFVCIPFHLWRVTNRQAICYELERANRECSRLTNGNFVEVGTIAVTMHPSHIFGKENETIVITASDPCHYVVVQLLVSNPKLPTHINPYAP